MGPDRARRGLFVGRGWPDRVLPAQREDPVKRLRPAKCNPRPTASKAYAVSKRRPVRGLVQSVADIKVNAKQFPAVLLRQSLSRTL